MVALVPRPPRSTGPIELRDFGPSGRRLGTAADCYDGSPWELHRGELVEAMGSKDLHGITMALLAALFRNHARAELTVMTDVYCVLDDSEGPSLRAPDVAVVGGLSAPRNEAFAGRLILAAEVRATQSKRYLEEKVALYIEHDWPCVWIAHVERQELEVVRPGRASPTGAPSGRGPTSVTYRGGAAVPLPEELDKHGLTAVPAIALFDERQASTYIDGWVKARAMARAVLDVLEARGLRLPDALAARVAQCNEPATLGRWLAAAATATDAHAFAAAVEAQG